jgi:hypothetical protein
MKSLLDHFANFQWMNTDSQSRLLTAVRDFELFPSLHFRLPQVLSRLEAFIDFVGLRHSIFE